MNVESTEIVWLTDEEVRQAILDFVKTKGFIFHNSVRVTGLESISKTDGGVSVQINYSMEEVKS